MYSVGPLRFTAFNFEYTSGCRAVLQMVVLVHRQLAHRCLYPLGLGSHGGCLCTSTPHTVMVHRPAFLSAGGYL
jgi:hypothetical protein